MKKLVVPKVRNGTEPTKIRKHVTSEHSINGMKTKKRNNNILILRNF